MPRRTNPAVLPGAPPVVANPVAGSCPVTVTPPPLGGGPAVVGGASVVVVVGAGLGEDPTVVAVVVGTWR
jgi:hypothetical protein